ncbi:hypothetical protein N431DRAFT_462155 [Stipitochalara longipes BDJ]|nr:hypothetical protein N431DRAFT_462155 [Stipitochalara longipes BDJ]
MFQNELIQNKQPSASVGTESHTARHKQELWQKLSGEDGQESFEKESFGVGQVMSKSKDDEATANAFCFGLSLGSMVKKCEDDEVSQASNTSSSSSILSVVNSVFTMASGSSMTSLSAPYGASERLVGLLLDDSVIRHVCSGALLVIERERFERNLRRLLKGLATGLRKEAGTTQQRQAAHFVGCRARNSAHLICNSLEKDLRLDTRKRNRTDVEEECGSEENDSNPSEDELGNLNQLENLQYLELFIQSSYAIGIFRTKLTAFVFPLEKQIEQTRTNPNFEKEGRKNEYYDELGTTSQSSTEDGCETSETEKSDNKKPLYIMLLERAAVLERLAMELRNPRPPIPIGKTRIEWKCKCGRSIYDDFIELQLGAAERLKQTLTHPTNAQFHQLVHDSLFAVFGKGTQSSLPLHERHTRSNALSRDDQTLPVPQMTLPKPQFLPICYSEGRYATRLMQPDLVTQNINSDRAFFELLRKSYQVTRGRISSFVSLQTLSSIKFVHFELYCSELVDVRKVDDIPLPEHVEYRYAPVPPELVPPIGHNHLMHLFHNPSCALDSPVLMQRFPKKILRPLTCPNLNPLTPGWGIQFLSTYSAPKLFILFSIFFGLGSLVFGILWCAFKHSIQDAFAIAAYVVALGTVSLGSVHALLVM